MKKILVTASLVSLGLGFANMAFAEDYICTQSSCPFYSISSPAPKYATKGQVMATEAGAVIDTTQGWTVGNGNGALPAPQNTATTQIKSAQ
jgi:hypothetical protein